MMQSADSSILSDSTIVFRIPARLADVRLLGISAHSLFANLGFSDLEVYQLELAITEAANNIVKHAYQYKDDMYMSMKFTIKEDKVYCTLVDKGDFENFLKNNARGEIAADTQVLPPDSRGIAIICEVMDEVSYRRSGSKNILTLVKYLP
jgi:serine/threonine-protein kinase RsbW